VFAWTRRGCDPEHVWEESEQRYAVASLTAPSVPMTAFTEEAREAVVLARECAHARGDERVGTEHLLIGLLDVEEGLAASVLGSLGVTVDEVRDHVLRMGAPTEPMGVAEDVTVTPRSRKVLELALREAIVLGFSAAGTEHILLALLREDECVAAGILRQLVPGADPEIRNAVIRVLADAYPDTLRTQPVPFRATPRNPS
jgi:ATP-dependent Clp protease ATP-binding subunit ClpC